MNWRKVFFFLLIAALTVAAVLRAWSWRGHLLANKGLYLINNEAFSDAERFLLAADAAGEHDRAQHLLARLDLNRGRPADALSRLERLGSGQKTAFDRGAALYLLGETTAALAAFRAASESGKYPYAALAMAALDEGSPLQAVPPEPAEAHRVDRLLWHAMTGRLALRDRRYQEAADLLERALVWGDTNPETPFLAAAAAALSADYSAAESLIGPKMTDQKFRSRMAEYFNNLISQTHIPAFSQTDLALVTKRQLEAAHASAWIGVRGALSDRDTTGMEAVLARLEALMAEWPRDLLLRMWRAEMLAALGRDREAYLAYRDLCDDQPVYAVLLRMLDLAGPDEQLLAEADAVLSSTAVVAVLGQNDFVLSGPVQRYEMLAFLENGSAATTATVPQAGMYTLWVVGRADPASGVWPRVDVDINGQLVGSFDVAGEEWNCHAIPAMLSAGGNCIQLHYSNDREHPSRTGEDRNFYLRQMIIGRTNPAGSP